MTKDYTRENISVVTLLQSDRAFIISKLKSMSHLLKNIISLCTLFAFNSFAYSQDGEFKQYNNGLIYSDTTMTKLHYIIDSLNIKYRKCETWKTYYARKQAVAYSVYIQNESYIDNATNDIKNGISYEDFIEKYSDTNSKKTIITKRFERDKKGRIIYETLSLNPYFNPWVETSDTSLFDSSQRKSWVINNTNDDEDNNLQAFYIIEGFSPQEIPEEYAKLIQYVDCMIDTNSHIYLKNATYSGIRFKKKNIKHPAYNKFISFLEKNTMHPKYRMKHKKGDAYWDSVYAWELKLDSVVHEKLVPDPEFKKLLGVAIEEAITHKYAAKELEKFAERYYSPEAALTLKRSRIVVGGCSMDASPRYHALNIAQLSAETIKWEIFFRAHLDIMNDNFSRVSDGSWAYAGRQTYIKELEELDIDIMSLILGISLDMENPSSNHYFGNIGRLGRAIAESEKKEEFEVKMSGMISDSRLDIQNRINIYYMFKNYAYSLKDENEKKIAKEKSDLLALTFPEYISSVLLENKWE